MTSKKTMARKIKAAGGRYSRAGKCWHLGDAMRGTLREVYEAL